MKKLIIFISLISLFIYFSCNDSTGSFIDYNSETDEYYYEVPVLSKYEHESLKQESKGDYLFLMYLAGDSNSIQNDLFRNMISVSRGLKSSKQNIKAIAFYDSNSSCAYYKDTDKTQKLTDTYVFEINPSSYSLEDDVCADDFLKDVSSSFDYLTSNDNELDSGDYKTLAEFIKWAQKIYNSNNDKFTILTIGTHGFGSYGFNSVEQQARSMSPDFTSYSHISTAQISQAFIAAGLSSENKLDMLMYDMCLCGTIEEAYEICDYAKSILFSPNLSPGAGFPYEAFITKLKADSTIFTVGQNMVNTFATTYYKSYDNNRPRTITFVDLSYIKDLAPLLTNLADYAVNDNTLQNALNGTTRNFLYSDNSITSDSLDYQCQIWKENSTFNSSAEYNYYYSFDIGYLTDMLYSFSSASDELKNICEEIRVQLEKAIVVSWRGSSDRTNSTVEGSYLEINSSRNYYGITITGNSAINQATKTYNHPYTTSSAFTEDTNWGFLLKVLYPEEFS